MTLMVAGFKDLGYYAKINNELFYDMRWSNVFLLSGSAQSLCISSTHRFDERLRCCFS
jgi:hypothetical protein